MTERQSKVNPIYLRQSTRLLEHSLGHRRRRKFGFRPVPNAEIIENRRLGHYRRSKSIICAVFLLLVELFVHPNLHQKHCFWWRFRLHQKLHQKHKFCLANRGVYRFVWFNLVQRRISRPIDRVRSGQVRSCQVRSATAAVIPGAPVNLRELSSWRALRR